MAIPKEIERAIYWQERIESLKNQIIFALINGGTSTQEAKRLIAELDKAYKEYARA